MGIFRGLQRHRHRQVIHVDDAHPELLPVCQHHRQHALAHGTHLPDRKRSHNRKQLLSVHSENKHFLPLRRRHPVTAEIDCVFTVQPGSGFCLDLCCAELDTVCLQYADIITVSALISMVGKPGFEAGFQHDNLFVFPDSERSRPGFGKVFLHLFSLFRCGKRPVAPNLFALSVFRDTKQRAFKHIITPVVHKLRVLFQFRRDVFTNLAVDIGEEASLAGLLKEHCLPALGDSGRPARITLLPGWRSCLFLDRDFFLLHP